VVKNKVKKAPLKLDLGCGKNKREGFTGVDAKKFPGVDQVVDLTKTPWPWKDGSVAEVNASHFIEHLTAPQRIAFANELYRILVPGGKCDFVVPHWNSQRAYGDLTHQWPPVSEFWFYYLRKEWRDVNAPHNDFYTCDFVFTGGYNLNPELSLYAEERRQFEAKHYRDAAADIVGTLTKQPETR
jgi:hypothetical protein